MVLFFTMPDILTLYSLYTVVPLTEMLLHQTTTWLIPSPPLRRCSNINFAMRAILSNISSCYLSPTSILNHPYLTLVFNFPQHLLSPNASPNLPIYYIYSLIVCHHHWQKITSRKAEILFCPLPQPMHSEVPGNNRYSMSLFLNNKMIAFLNQCFSKYGLPTLGGSQIFFKDPQVQNCFHNNTKTICVSFTIQTFTLIVQSNVDKTIGTLAPIKRVAPNYSSSHCILHCHTLR